MESRFCSNVTLFFAENEEDFDFIDPSILKQFQRTSISIEKIQKEIFNFDEKGGKSFYVNQSSRFLQVG